MAISLHVVDVNGAPGLALVDDNQPAVVSLLSLDIDAGERVRNVWIVVNPEKLARVRLPAS
jgi:hypothetical protein